MRHRVVPIAEEHLDGFRAALDSVAREHLYLALLEAPEAAAVREFVLGNLRAGHPQFVALVDDAVVGWCDVLPGTRPVFRHSGVLGMGVVRAWRRRGIGWDLMTATIAAAQARGLTRIELTVRADNRPARRLYERFRFAVEGRLRHHMWVDGEYHDSYLMALVADATAGRPHFDCVFYTVRDLDRAVAFYTEVLGLRLVSRDVVARLDLDGVSVELVPTSGGTGWQAAGNARLTLAVDDLGATATDLAARGVAVSAVRRVDNGSLVTFADPDGNELVLWQDS